MTQQTDAYLMSRFEHLDVPTQQDFIDFIESKMRLAEYKETIFRPQWYGALADGVTDDRVAIQACIDDASATTGAVIYFSPGVYIVSKSVTTGCLNFDGCENMIFRGAGMGRSIIRRLAGNYTGNTHIMQTFADSHFVTFEDLTLDGNRQNCTDADEQRHGLYLSGVDGPCSNIIANRCSFVNLKGDGIFALGVLGTDPTYWVSHVMVANCYFAEQARSTGGAHQRGVRYVWWLYNRLISSNDSDAALDFESTGNVDDSAIDHLWVVGNYIQHGRASFAVSLTGRDSTDLMEHCVFANNQIVGGSIQVGQCSDVIVTGNTFEGLVDSVANSNILDMFGPVDDVRITDNVIISDTDNAAADQAAIKLDYSNGPFFPNNVVIERNKIYVLGPEETVRAIRVTEPGNNVIIRDNEIHGAGLATSIGVSMALSIGDTTPRYNWRVDGNTITNFAEGIRMSAPNTTTPIEVISICDNHMFDTGGSPVMTTGINLAGSNIVSIHTLAIHGNIFGPTVTTPLLMGSGSAASKIINIGGLGASAGGVKSLNQWQCVGTPEGLITASIGSVAYRSDGAANLARYLKASGTGNTGWIDDGEQRLSSTTGLDMNALATTTLYTVPTGFSCLITRIVLRLASASLTTASFSIGFTASGHTDVIANATHTELTGNTLYTVLLPKAGATVGTTGGTLRLRVNTAEGSAATLTVAVFGYLF